MNNLAKLLSELSHLDLEGLVCNKQPYASGFGSSCDVYTAWSIRHSKKVAVKQIRVFLKKDEYLAKHVASEIRIWMGLSHPNVLPLLGFLAEGENMTPNLVSEWMEKGTLHEYKTTFPRCSEDTCIMLYGIASGLAYLHTKGIIHADLKSQNVLISPHKTPLLADFGLSIILSQSRSTLEKTTSFTRGTVRWMAKELFFSSANGGAPKHTTMSDIWAFGMIVYELLSWKMPYSYNRQEHIVMLSIMNGELPERPDPCGDLSVFSNLWSLCGSCWSEISARPTAYQIMAYLASVNIKVQSEYLALLDQLAMRTRNVADSSDDPTYHKITYGRYAIHYTLFTWAPPPRKPDDASMIFPVCAPTAVTAPITSRPALTETNLNLPPVTRSTTPIALDGDENLRSRSSSSQLPNLSCLKTVPSGSANAYVNSVMSELFSWSTPLADENHPLYEF